MAKKKTPVIDLAYVKRQARKITGEKEGKDFDIAVAMLSACVVGPNIVRVAKFAQLPRETIRQPFNRLRDNYVFIGDKLNVQWFSKNDGGIAFILDLMTAQGLVERTE